MRRTSPTSPAAPPLRGRPATAAAAAAAIAVVLLTVATALASPAGAQSATTLAPPTTLPAENPGSTTAGVVFFGVCAVVIVGALVLYLRNRRPRVAAPDAGT